MTDSVKDKRVPDHDGFHTESVDDLVELLQRAENFCIDGLGFEDMAKEFEEARAFVEDEIAEKREPELVTDGGRSETELPQEGDLVRWDRGNEPGHAVGVVEKVKPKAGAMLVRATESTAAKIHVKQLYSIGIETADWKVVEREHELVTDGGQPDPSIDDGERILLVNMEPKTADPIIETLDEMGVREEIIHVV